MIKGFLAGALLVVASFTTAFTVGTMVPAHAGTVSEFTGSHSSLWWDGATCREFAAGHVHAMVVDSRHADTYLRVDVRQLAHDALVKAPHEVQVNDNLNVSMDCHYTGDQGS